MGEGLDLGGQRGIGRQDVQFLYYGGVIVLVRLPVVSRIQGDVVGSVVSMHCPLVHQADVLPEKVAGVAVESARGEGGVLEVCCGEVGDDELEELFRQVLKLACEVSA